MPGLIERSGYSFATPSIREVLEICLTPVVRIRQSEAMLAGGTPRSHRECGGRSQLTALPRCVPS